MRLAENGIHFVLPNLPDRAENGIYIARLHFCKYSVEARGAQAEPQIRSLTPAAPDKAAVVSHNQFLGVTKEEKILYTLVTYDVRAVSYTRAGDYEMNHRLIA